MDRAALWRTAQHGWPARFPLVQFPNAPLLLAIIAWVVAKLTDGDVHDTARGAFLVLLGAWAFDEVARGTNLFRRALGLFFLVSTVLQVADALGS